MLAWRTGAQLDIWSDGALAPRLRLHDHVPIGVGANEIISDKQDGVASVHPGHPNMHVQLLC
jgi:hypothetical protein